MSKYVNMSHRAIYLGEFIAKDFAIANLFEFRNLFKRNYTREPYPFQKWKRPKGLKTLKAIHLVINRTAVATCTLRAPIFSQSFTAAL